MLLKCESSRLTAVNENIVFCSVFVFFFFLKVSIDVWEWEWEEISKCRYKNKLNHSLFWLFCIVADSSIKMITHSMHELTALRKWNYTHTHTYSLKCFPIGCRPRDMHYFVFVMSNLYFIGFVLIAYVFFIHSQ